MEKKAIIFLDYNETFDDVADGKGAVFIASLRRFIKYFNGEVKIAVITSAFAHTSPEISIKPDISLTLSYIPSEIRQKFCYLIEENCKYLSYLNCSRNDIIFTSTITMSHMSGTKKNGVENLLNFIDPLETITTCIFAGDSEVADLPMIEAEIGNREKILLLANKRILKAERFPVYKLSMLKEKSFVSGKEILDSKKDEKGIIIKTTPKSFGVGKGIEAVTNYLMEKDKQNREK